MLAMVARSHSPPVFLSLPNTRSFITAYTEQLVNEKVNLIMATTGWEPQITRV